MISEELASDVLSEKGFPFNLKVKQLEIINSIISGSDTFAILPTGYGKTVCFFMPPLLLDKLNPTKHHSCLVISPLISLIKEQAKTLNDHGISAYGIYEGAEKSDLEAIKQGKATVLLASPESILTKHWKRIIEDQYNDKLCMVVYDEVHCISEWGLEFREGYRQVGVLQSITSCPVLAMTATCTTDILKDVCKQIGLSNFNIISCLPERPNITLCLVKESQKLENLNWIILYLKKFGIGMKKTIVYVNSVEMCERIYIWIHIKLKALAYHGAVNVNNRLVEMFHANTDKLSKERIMYSLKNANGSVKVLIATVAVGMGIDIPDIATVVIWGMPPSLLQLWQQIGRSGRGGQQSLAILYAYPRSIANPCNMCRKISKRTCNCQPRVYLRKSVDSNDCQRQYCLQFFAMNESNTNELSKLTSSPCDSKCVDICTCRMCRCCFTCIMKCECPNSAKSLSEIIENMYTTNG